MGVDFCCLQVNTVIEITTVRSVIGRKIDRGLFAFIFHTESKCDCVPVLFFISLFF